MTSQTRGSNTSIVYDVLKSAGRLDKHDLNARIGELGRKIEEVKGEVHETLLKKYADFFPNLGMAFDLQKRVQDITEEMATTKNIMENEIKVHLNMSKTEFHDLSKEYEDAQVTHSILTKLVGLENRFTACALALKSCDYTSCATKLREIRQLLNTNLHDREDDVKIFRVLREKYKMEREYLMSILDKIWASSVSWVLPREGNKNCSLSVCAGDEERMKLKTAFQAIHLLELPEASFQAFGNRLLRCMLKPVMDNCGIKVTSTVKERAELKLQQKDTKSTELSSLFWDITTVVNFVNKHLFFFKVDNVPTMELLGEVIAKEFLDYFTTACLAKSVPSNKEELDKYSVVASNIQTLQASLIKTGFLPSDCTVLTDYTSNINSLFANKINLAVLEKARVLFQVDLHNAVHVSGEPCGELPPLFQQEQQPTKETKLAENTAMDPTAQLSENTFAMPPCQISKSVQDLMNLAYETLHEAANSSAPCAVQLFYSLKNAFAMYCTVVPTYHKHNLETLPLLGALFHNNCMFLAHHLVTLGHQFRSKLPREIAERATFMDLVPQFRRLGIEIFVQQRIRLREQLMENLSEDNGFLSSEEDFSQTELSVRRVLHQLGQLARVWRGVLVTHLFHSAIGLLLNDVLGKLCDSIIELNDIRSDDAVRLHSFLKIVADKAPELLTEQSDGESEDEYEREATALLHKHVTKWRMFLEVQRVLSASLREIDERWADGKGPLAAELRADQVKKLVKALFQNTDRRAHVLSRIRERSK